MLSNETLGPDPETLHFAAGTITLFTGPVWGGKSDFMVALARIKGAALHRMGSLFPVQPERLDAGPLVLFDDLHAWFRYKRLRRSSLTQAVGTLLQGGAVAASWLGPAATPWPSDWPQPLLVALDQPADGARGSQALLATLRGRQDDPPPGLVRAVTDALDRHIHQLRADLRCRWALAAIAASPDRGARLSLLSAAVGISPQALLPTLLELERIGVLRRAERRWGFADPVWRHALKRSLAGGEEAEERRRPDVLRPERAPLRARRWAPELD